MTGQGVSRRVVAAVAGVTVAVVGMAFALRGGADTRLDDAAITAGTVEIDGADPTPTPIPTPAPMPTPTPAEPLALAPIATPTPTPFVMGRSVERRLPDHWSPVARPGAARGAGPTRDLPSGGVLGRWIGGSRWRYAGVLGRLGPDEAVVGAVADPLRRRTGRLPLTGLPGRIPPRRAIVVKIDNVPAAQPQTAINEADIVVEELVEGGMTRLAAVFHSNRPDAIGPVRSARSTDIGIASSYGRPVFANSGANSIFSGLVAQAPLIDRGNGVFGGYWRAGSRPAPHNMFTAGATLLESVQDPEGPPPPQFAYRDPGEALHPSAREASSIRLRYAEGGRSGLIEYAWDARLGGWRRDQYGSPHVDADGDAVAPENVIVWFVDYIDTGLTDKWGEVLYEGVSVGSGDALVFTDGHVIRARWTRPSLRSVATFTDASGRHIELTPGRTWISMIARRGATWS